MSDAQYEFKHGAWRTPNMVLLSSLLDQVPLEQPADRARVKAPIYCLRRCFRADPILRNFPGGTVRLNSTVLISAFILIIGLIFGQPYLWLPISVLIASIIELVNRPWTSSNKVGEWAAFSLILKTIFNLFGLYGLIGQIACLVLLGIWLFR